MQKHPYRTLLIWAVVILAAIYIYPTVGWMALSQEAREARLENWREEDAVYARPGSMERTWRAVKRWAEFDRDRVINLGLDLQGGVHMVLALDMDALEPARLQEYKDAGLSDTEIRQRLQQIALQRIRRRINAFEAQEPIIQALGNERIQVQLPGERDIQRAVNLIKNTAYLTFHIVSGRDEMVRTLRDVDEHFDNRLVPFLRDAGPRRAHFTVPIESLDQVQRLMDQATEEPGLLPEGKAFALSQPPNPWDDQHYELYLIEDEPIITGEGLRRASAVESMEMPGRYQIGFEFGGDAVAQFASVTEQNVGKDMAIVVDGVVVSSATIQERIWGQGRITGNFSREQAVDLAIALNSGSMPVPIQEDYTGVVGASLGADSIRKGVWSSIIGLLVVLAFMIVYYRLAGVVANVALFLNAVLVLAVLSSFRGTLTLPGIAGLILTIGMAVDANVLIFERIREELRNGKSLLSSIDAGYKRATTTILDANVTTLIAAAVLMQFGTGPIAGFAVTLTIGICSSVFTALVVTRAIFDFLTSRQNLSRLTMMSIMKPETHVKFLGKRYMAFTASAILIIAGLAVFAARGTGNFGVDFTYGTNVLLRIENPEMVSVADVRDQLHRAGFTDAIVQESGTGIDMDRNAFLVRIGRSAFVDTEPVAEAPDPEDMPSVGVVEEELTDEPVAARVAPLVEAAPPAGEETVSGRIRDALMPLAVGDVEFDQIETVGPAVGRQLRRDAQQAILFALFFIVLYLWFRFELKFAVGAVAALVHDVLVTVGLFALTGREITMPVVAALLTIIGYSLNDTIVVFDRIREDMRLYRGRGLSYTDVMDLSINQTLSRTLLTSLTTLFVVVVLFIFGGAGINDFAFALIVGVLVGTYSSIFVASPLVYLLQLVPFKQYWLRLIGRQTKQQASENGRKRRKDREKATV